MGNQWLKSLSLLAVGALSTLFLSGCPGGHEAAVEVVLNASQSGETVYLQQGERLRIAINTDPSSSAGWQLSGYDRNLLKFAGTKLVSTDEDEYGLSALQVYSFQARRTGESRLRLERIDGDEEEFGAIDEYELQVVVEPKQHLASAR